MLTSGPKVAVAASFTAFPILEPLRFWLHEVLDLNARIELADVGQVMQTLLDPKAIFAMNPGGLNVVLLRWEDLCGRRANDKEDAVELLVSVLSSAIAVSRIPHLICVCPPSPPMSERFEQTAEFQAMDDRLKSETARLPGVFVVSSNELLQLYPVTHYSDALSDKLALVPYRSGLFIVLAALIARRLHAATIPPYKAIVIDCDQTLWTGVCGEDGALGVIIDGPRQALQKFLVAQHDAGMLVCLCSKNSEEDVFKVFEERGEMLLKLHHIAAHRINWESKADNLRSLARELGIGTDSMVFIDDSPLESAEVRGALPEVLTLDLPADTGSFDTFLRSVWAFDRRAFTSEDGSRTAQYRQERDRKQLRKQVTSLAEFLAALDLEVKIRPLNEADLGRSAQLLQRVNQFNLSSARRSEAELAAQWLSQTLEGLAVEVSDRFGDYGQVGLLLFGGESDCLKIDSFLLSCRALGRGVEHQMLAALGTVAHERGLCTVELPFLETSRNRPMRDFLESIIGRIGKVAQSGSFFVPADLAAGIRYFPALKDQPAISAETNFLFNPRAEPVPNQQAQDRSCLLARIATVLANPEQILSAFESWQRTTRIRPEKKHVAPANIVESSLVRIWEEVFHVEPIGTRDVFFELEGDSLKMVQIIVRVVNEFAIEFPVTFFFDHPTIEAHARKIIELQNSMNENSWKETVMPAREESADSSRG